MKCWKCGFEMPQDAIFCSKCGSNLSKAICESCGKQIPLEAKFCIFCGSKVHSIEEKRAAESLLKSSDISQKEAVKQTQQTFTEKQDKANALASKEQAAEKKDNLSEIKPIVDHAEEPKRSFSWNNRKGTSKVSYSLTKMDVDFKEKSLQVVKTKGKNEEKNRNSLREYLWDRMFYKNFASVYAACDYYFIASGVHDGVRCSGSRRYFSHSCVVCFYVLELFLSDLPF